MRTSPAGATGSTTSTSASRAARAGRRASAALATILVVALLGACGVREDDSPRPLAADAVPAELSEPTRSSTIPQAPTTPQRIFVLEKRGTDEVLAGVFFGVPVLNDADDFPRRVIEQLVNLPLAEDSSFSTAIPATTGVLDVRRVTGPSGDDDVLEINLNQLEAAGPGLKLAIAQIVFTATGITGINGVRFLLNGVPVAVPLDSGESGVGAIVTEDDFATLNPASTTTTTTTTQPATTEQPADDPTAG